MPRCAFYTAKFTQCTHTAQDGAGHCWAHVRTAERLGLRAPGTCPCLVQNGRAWCGRALEGENPICQRHATMRETRVEREAQRRVNHEQMRLSVAEIVENYMIQEPRPHWRAVTDIMFGRSQLPAGAPDAVEEMTAFNVARRFYNLTAPHEDLMANVFINQWLGIPEDWAPAVPVLAAPVPALGRLAMDTQSVHTEVVVTQTNTNVDLLLKAAEGASADVDPEGWVVVQWLQTPYVKFQDCLKVIQDVHHWFTKRTCKTTGDYLYKRVFTGVIAKLVAIDDAEVRGELVKRLWEECSEALDMCCEGHISRLANVFVGFDAAFKSPASPNEMLQTQIAEIAQLKLRLETKLAKANAVMDELKIPVEDRLPWLQALAE
jgi:hypothetical protein